MKKRVLALFLVFLLFSVPALQAVAAGGGVTVYVTRTGEKYHRDGCSYLKSRIAISLQDAVNQGYTPCSRCQPPVLGSAPRGYSYSEEGNIALSELFKDEANPTPQPTQSEEKDHTGRWVVVGGGLVAAYLLGKRRGKS